MNICVNVEDESRDELASSPELWALIHLLTSTSLLRPRLEVGGPVIISALFMTGVSTRLRSIVGHPSRGEYPLGSSELDVPECAGC